MLRDLLEIGVAKKTRRQSGTELARSEKDDSVTQGGVKDIAFIVLANMWRAENAA